MDPIIGSTLIGIGGNLLGGALNNLFNSGSAGTSFNRQKELLSLQNQYARQNWQMENAYNLPSAQRRRLKEAGLNPDLMYGNGAAGLVGASIGNPSGGSAPMQAPSAIDFGASAAMQAAQNMQNSKKVTDAQVALMDAQAKNLNSQTTGQDITNQRLGEVLSAQVDEAKSRMGLNAAQTRNFDAQVDKMSKEIEVMSETISEIQSRVSLNKIEIKWREPSLVARIRQMAADTNLSYQQAEDICKTQWARIQSLENNAEYMQALSGTASAEAASIRQHVTQQKFMTEFLSSDEGRNYQRTMLQMNRDQAGMNVVNSVLQGAATMVGAGANLAGSGVPKTKTYNYKEVYINKE